MSNRSPDDHEQEATQPLEWFALEELGFEENDVGTPGLETWCILDNDQFDHRVSDSAYREWQNRQRQQRQRRAEPKRESHLAKLRRWITPPTDWSDGRAVLVCGAWWFAAACFVWVLYELLPSAVVGAAISAVVASLVTLGVVVFLLFMLVATMDKADSPILFIAVAAVGFSLVAIIGLCTFQGVYENANGPVTEEATRTEPAANIAEPSERPVNPYVKAIQDAARQTPRGRAEVDRLENKDAALTEFQKTHNISDAMAEAAISEWVLTHNHNYDWRLNEVKAICLRLKQDTLPRSFR